MNDDVSSNKTDQSFKSLALLNANARSLKPKIESLSDCMYELDADIAVVTETWFQDGSNDLAAVDLAGEHGLVLFPLNRQVVAANGRQYGGVAITTRSSRTTFKKVEIPNPECFEVLCIAGKVKGIAEKVVVIAVYIPPNYPKPRADACLDYIADVVSASLKEGSNPRL